jgi:hypothetical protein
MAKEPTATERIDYLVGRRFPLSYLLKIRPSVSLSSRAPSPDTRELRIVVEAFRRELAALTPEALVARFNEAKGKELEQLRAKAEQEEREQFFNHPSARADFEHWSKAAHWTLDEAIALSFGRAPELVRWERLQKLTAFGSPFVAQYARRRDLALRAKSWEQLFDPVLPGIFLAWAKRTDIDVPAELVEAVQKRGVQIADWKGLYEQAAAGQKRAIEMYERATQMHDGQIADWKRLYDQANEALQAARDQIIEILEEKNRLIAALEESVALSGPADASLTGPTAEEKSLSTKERETLLKIVIGMARDSYKYDPKLNRSSVPQEIADDLAKHSIFLDVDTVRKWLKQAAEFLPGE